MTAGAGVWGGMSSQPAVQFLPVDDLLLDTQNPRLPSSLLGASEAEVWAYLKDECVLEELVLSFRSNGYFAQEPMLVEPDAGGRYTVLEGNRRLAALLWLFSDVRTGHAALVPPPEERELAPLRSIPCLVTNRADAHAYLGFRHVGGLKEWGPAEKARWVHAEVARRQAAGVPDKSIFYEIGRAIGNYQNSVRNLYLPYALLILAQERGVDVQYVLTSGFGVLTRALSAAELRTFLGLEDISSPDEISKSLQHVDVTRLGTVLRDFTPEFDGSAKKRAPSVLGDSRNISRYATVVANPEAWKVLRQTNDLESAHRVATRSNPGDELQRIAVQLRAQIDGLQRALPWDIVRISPIVQDLKAAVRALEAQVKVAESELAE